MEGLDSRITAIGEDQQHGAMYLAIDAMRVVADAAGPCKEESDWPDCLRAIADRVAASKPAMAAVRNAADLMADRLVQVGREEAEDRATSLAEEFIGDLQAATDRAAAHGADVVPPSSTVLTCSYSATVLGALLKAHEAGKQPRVSVLVPDPTPGAPGSLLVHDLEVAGIPARAIDPDGLPAALDEAQAVLIGADAVTPTYIVNGTPSLEVAQIASGRTPVYVVCETIKFIRGVDVDLGYDRIPPELAKAIVTEDGILSIQDVDRILSERAGWPMT